jgi:hypothetical protein
VDTSKGYWATEKNDIKDSMTLGALITLKCSGGERSKSFFLKSKSPPASGL